MVAVWVAQLELEYDGEEVVVRRGHSPSGAASGGARRQGGRCPVARFSTPPRAVCGSARACEAAEDGVVSWAHPKSLQLVLRVSTNHGNGYKEVRGWSSTLRWCMHDNITRHKRWDVIPKRQLSSEPPCILNRKTCSLGS